jgi:hypothetical protein
MATATAVSINVVVNGTQAVEGIDAINAKLGTLGPAATAGTSAAGAGLGRMDGQLASSREGVRLLSEEFGLRMPRALTSIISKIGGVGQAVQSAMVAMAGFAMLEVLERAGEAVYNLYEKYLSVTSVAEKFYDEMKKNSEADFTNTRSIEDTTLRINQATQAMVGYNAVAEADHKGGLLNIFGGNFMNPASGIAGMIFAHQAAEAGSAAGKQMEQLSPKELEDRHQLALLNIEADHATDSQLKGQQKITAELDKQKALHAENRKFNKDMDLALGNPVASDSGSAEETAQNRLAQGKANADLAALRITNSKEAIELQEKIIAMQNEAVNAGLEGDARLAAEKQQSLDKLTREFHEGEINRQTWLAETAATAQKYDNQRLLADRKSLTESASQAQEIWDEATKEDEERQIEQLRKQTEEAHKAAELQSRIADQEAEYAARASEAERRVRNVGLTGWISDHQAAIAAIQAQDDAETQNLHKLAQDEGMSEQQAAQAKVNIDRAANAQIAQANQEMSHQIANTLQSAFEDPVDFIKRKMQQMMFEILAQWISQLKIFQGVFGSTMGGMQAGGQQGGLLGMLMPHARAAAGGGSVGLPAGSGAAGGPASAGSGSSGAAIEPSDVGMATMAQIAGPSGNGAVSALGEGSSYIPGKMSSTSALGAGSPRSAQISANGAGELISSGTSLVGTASKVHASMAAQKASDGVGGATIGSLPASDSPSSLSFDENGNVTSNAQVGGEQQQQSMQLAQMKPGGGVGEQHAVTGANDAMGAYMGYNATKADFKSGSVGGTMKGMATDASIGFMIGGPLGAIIGAAVGLVAGVVGGMMGEGGRLAARDYYKKSLFPEIEKERHGDGSTDFQSAISAVNKTAADGLDYMRLHWGRSSAEWVNDNYLRKEQMLAVGQIEARAKGGSYAVGMSAKQFHEGGEITGFGSFGTGGDEGFFHGQLGETVMSRAASDTHGAVLHAMNAGASATDVARMYLAGSPAGGGSHSLATAAATNHQWNVQALDAKSFDQFLRGGAARTVVKHVNQFASQYAGDGING